MSNLVVSNISDGTTSVGTGYVVNGSAKAWCYLNGSGTIAVVSSLNTSSLTDNGTGDYKINVTNAFSSEPAHFGLGGNVSYWAANTTGSEIRISITNTSGVLTDTNRVTGAGFGDLA